nr:hypothetical protein [Tanacetum cinerariifolium]GFB39451.1 hypothetical protein [Tanacetum cinerariifolium]
MAQVTGCQAGSFLFTYLGLPIGKNMRRKSSWNTIVDKFKAKLSTWKENLLSIGGRYTLIKSVLRSLRIYYFSLFKAPKVIIHNLERLRFGFFWGGSDNINKMTWIKWENVLAPMECGGLGIGSLLSFNLALIQKWHWRLADIIGSSNYLHSRNLIPKDVLKCNVDCLISDRLIDGGWSWKWRRPITSGRSEYMLHSLLSEVQYTTLSSSPDRWSWSINADGLFTVSSTRSYIDRHILPSLNTETRWNKCLPRKVNIFIWRLRLDRLPHRLNLFNHGLDIASILYPLCNQHVESNEHVFFSCDVALNFWRLIRIWCNLSDQELYSFEDCVSRVIALPGSNAKKDRLFVIVASTFWIL